MNLHKNTVYTKELRPYRVDVFNEDGTHFITNQCWAQSADDARCKTWRRLRENGITADGKTLKARAIRNS